MARVAGFLLVIASMAWAGLALAQPAPAAPHPSPPPGMTQQQFDGLVEAISQAVVRKLKAEDKAAPGAASGVAGTPSAGATTEELVDAFIGRALRVGAAFPETVRATLGIPAALDDPGRGRPFLLGLLILLSLVAAALGVEWLARRLLTGLRERLADRAGAAPGIRALTPLAAIAGLDFFGLVGVWLLSYGSAAGWGHAVGVQARFAGFVLVGVFAWRLYMFAFRVVMRPGLPKARLAALSDEDATAAYRGISTLILGIVLVRIYIQTLLAMHTASEAVSAAQVICNIGIVAGMIWTALVHRKALGVWFASLGAVEGRRSVGEFVGRNWLFVAVPLFVLLGAAQIFGAISGRFTIPAAMLLTLNVLIALVFLETLSDYITRPLRGSAAAALQEGTAAPVRHQEHLRLIDVVARCVRVAAVIVAVLVIAQTWVVDVLAIVDVTQWRSLTRASFTAGTTLFVAYVLWELVKFASDRYSAKSASPGHGDDEANLAGGATRLATMMPLLRIALAIVISVVALLIVLSELGVNITPLIAGASVFGLAISFGSQTLVRDIVSGIFYLADDAFRVGEYIDCGKAKGTVEGFTLRSIRLRHQNGQVHTIPFGQLGQITNFSRDWATLKFNLRFDRHTDLEKLRKLVKKIGQEMLEDPELKDEFLEPLKMQGVADILDNAIVVRFKFTVRPNKPTFVQRQAVKRMVAAFGAAGIEFASNTVAVQTFGGGMADGGLAAGGALAKAQAEAAASSKTVTGQS
jgi:moderate conductance mechanosensitive channel